MFGLRVVVLESPAGGDETCSLVVELDLRLRGSEVAISSLQSGLSSSRLALGVVSVITGFGELGIILLSSCLDFNSGSRMSSVYFLSRRRVR